MSDFQSRLETDEKPWESEEMKSMEKDSEMMMYKCSHDALTSNLVRPLLLLVDGKRHTPRYS